MISSVSAGSTASDQAALGPLPVRVVRLAHTRQCQQLGMQERHNQASKSTGTQQLDLQCSRSNFQHEAGCTF